MFNAVSANINPQKKCSGTGMRMGKYGVPQFFLGKTCITNVPYIHILVQF